MLGTGGVLDRYDYLSTIMGMREGHFANTKSQAALYWWDDERNELQTYRIGSAPTALSKEKGIQNYLNKNTERTTKPALFFDIKYDEVMSSAIGYDEIEHNNVVRLPKTITFSEIINAYSSIYDISFVGGITLDGQ